MQIKEKRRFCYCCIIGYFSHLTPTIVWHNVQDLTAIASAAADGVVCGWACYLYSNEENVFYAFYSLILFPEEIAPYLFWNEQFQKINYECPSSHHLLWFVYSMFLGVFFKVVEICGQRMEEFIKPFPNKEIISDKIQLALKRWQHLFFSHWEIPHHFSFIRHMGEMGTWGSRVNNAHLRHVTSRAISWCTDSETQKSLGGEGGRAREEDREKDW